MYRNVPQDGKIRIQQGLPSEKLKTAVAEAASYKVRGGSGEGAASEGAVRNWEKW